MDHTAFDRLTVRFAGATTRRRLIGRAAKLGAAAAATAALGRTAVPADAQNCPYGPNTCQQGYVWRNAYDGDAVCVLPSVRDQAYADNAAAASRVDPNGAYGPSTCVSGYVWREAFAGDLVCVEPWVRDQAAADNAAAKSRVEPGCADGGTCRAAGVVCDYDHQCCGSSGYCCWDGISLRTECRDVSTTGGRCPI